MGVLSVAAKLHPEWKSMVDAAPSPKYTIEIAFAASVSFFFSGLDNANASNLNLYAAPTAWVICVPNGLLIVW